MSGVYIIKNIDKSTKDKLFVKIGCSKNCDSRFSQIKSSFKFNGSDDSLELMQVIPCNQYRKLEKILHKILAFARQNGEWFYLTEKDESTYYANFFS
jgi:hypothetical protein